MVPHTYPSTYASNGQQQMVVSFITDIAGKQRWLDYIPVKFSIGFKENSYDNDGFINIVETTPTSTDVPFKDYVPVYSDGAASDAWEVSSVGFIPIGRAGLGGASLNLDLGSSGVSLDSRITFTRASSATRFNSSGVLQTVGNNVARFNHDPVTLAPLGLLIEEQRTNLLLQSATLSTQTITVTAVAHTLSFYGTGMVTLSGASTGAVVGTGAFPSRRTFTFTPTAGSLTLTVTGTVQFAQVEVGAFATSYIPTTTAAATRAADVAVMTGTNFSSWYNQSEGTFFVEAGCSGYGSGNASCPIGVSGGTSANVVLIGQAVSGGNLRSISIVAGGVTSAVLQSAGFPLPTAIKVAAAYKENDFAGSIFGATTQTDNSGAVPTTVDRMVLGGSISGGIQTLNGHIKRIQYWPTRLTNAQLQSLTA